MKQKKIFDDPKPRKPRRVMMHVYDAGESLEADRPFGAVLTCKRCGYKTGWLSFRTFSDTLRGLPCPQCNEQQEKDL